MGQTAKKLEVSQQDARPRGADIELGAPHSTRLGSYLRNLREGYRYTLRKVEERAMAMGESIDNSQLSRFEKGKAIPSFDKLRALARVFNVPVQNFSDVLDLEEYRGYVPEGDAYEILLREGGELRAKGEHGCAFIAFERAMELAENEENAERSSSMRAEARLAMATALKTLGKLFMAEHELRKLLREPKTLDSRLRIRALLQLSYLYRELGDSYLASVLAKESLELADESGDRLTRAGVMNTLGNIAHDEGDAQSAVEQYQGALEILEEVGGYHEMQATVLTNLGGCFNTLERYERGVPMLREAHTRARRGGFRRVAALSLTRLAESHQMRDQNGPARELLDESDALSSKSGDAYHDLLFLNAFRRWEMARKESNPTREKIAFGRLRHLRSQLQRRFQEVDAFDRFVERNRT